MLLCELYYGSSTYVGAIYPSFSGFKTYLKPIDVNSALEAEMWTGFNQSYPDSLDAQNPDKANFQSFVDFAKTDWIHARYRLDIDTSLKLSTTMTNKDIPCALAVAYSAAYQLCLAQKSRNSMGTYTQAWTESIDTDKLKASISFSDSLLHGCTIQTTGKYPIRFVVRDYADDVDLNSPQMSIIRREALEKPVFNALKTDGKKLYTLLSAYSTLKNVQVEDLGLGVGKKSKNGYFSINLNSKTAEGFAGIDYIKAKTAKSAVNMGVYQTIEDVRDAHPDKNTEWIEHCKYEIVTEDTLDTIMQELWEAPILSFDTETTGLNINFLSRAGLADELVGVCISGTPETGYYFPLQHKLFDNLCNGDHRYFMEHYMKALLETKPLICHNLSFDWKVAYIYEININCVFDTLLAFGVTKRYEYLDFPLGLKEVCFRLFNISMFEIEDFVIGKWEGSGITFADLPFDLVKHYGPADADITLRVYLWCLSNHLLDNYKAKRVFDLEVNFAKVVAYSEFWGYHIDVAQLPILEAEINDGMEKAKTELFKIAGKEFNPNSSVQLSKIVYQELYPELISSGIVTKASTAKDILHELEEYTLPSGEYTYPFIHYLLEYRRYETTHKNFLKKKAQFITPDGYVFAGVQQLGTNTGRVSIKDPNYQSYNDVVKKRVTGRPGFYIFDCDFAQIEYRVLASMAGQDALIKAFDDPDLDYHTHQAARMFSIPYAAVSKQLRQQSKGINFGLPYGMGDASLGARVFGARTPENTAKAADLRKRFFEGQEKIQDFFTRVRDQGVRLGYTETWLGRRRYYHREFFSEGAIRRQAGNHAIQGCLDGSVHIQTKEYGIVPISQVAGETLQVWDGKSWTRGDITYSGKKRKCIVHFTDGREFICSPDHKFAVVSHKGNVRFVACQDLVGRLFAKNSSSVHRVKISESYRASDAKYSSEEYYNITSAVHNANNSHLDDIQDSYGIGVVLGRLAADGTIAYNPSQYKYSAVQIIAEHEFDIIPELDKYMKRLNAILNVNECREDRNERIAHIEARGKALITEIHDLDIRHKIHNKLFADTELLRGFLRGVFDGDGGICGECVVFTQGVQDNFRQLCMDIQTALLFFGIRARYRYYAGDRHVLQIYKADTPRFAELIGFMNKKKQTKAEGITVKHDQHIFGHCLLVDYVEVTDDYVDMYDVCNTERGYFVADGIVTHNSAADIWKLAVTRFFNRIVKEGLLGKVLFNCFVHDELMGEVSVDINPYEFIKMWREEYEMRIDKFCRLYAGFGWGNSWYEAKKADYPPQFIDTLVAKAGVDTSWDGDYKKLITKTKQELYDFETKRVVDWYQSVPEGTILAPHIGGYLYSKLGDWWEDMAKTNPDLNNYTLKAKKGSDKQVATLDQAFEWFCQHENIPYKPNWILSPEAADAAKSNNASAPAGNTVEDDEDTELKRLEEEHQKLVCQQVYNMGFYLDVPYSMLVLNYNKPKMQAAVMQVITNYCKTDNPDGLQLVLMTFDAQGFATAYPQKYKIALKDFGLAQEIIRLAL